MNYTKEQLINHRVKRAEEALQEADLLAENEHWNTVINRLYYACFYTVSALLIKHNLDPKTHSGTKILFYEHFLKKAIIDKKYGEFYATLFNKRQESDYQDFLQLNKKDVLPLIEQSENFITKIKNLIHS